MALVNTYVPVSAVFKELSADIATLAALVRNLSRTDALFWCARLNLVISSSELDHLDAQHFGVLRFFDKAELDRINSYLSERKEVRPTVFFRAQLLELARWICLLGRDYPNDGNTFEDPDTRRRFAKAALIASDVWAERVYGNELRLTDDLKSDRKRLLGVTRRAMLENASAPDLSRTLTRGHSIYNRAFHDALPTGATEFHALAGVSLAEYFGSLGTIAAWHFEALSDKHLSKSVILSFNTIKDSLSEAAAVVMTQCLGLDAQTPDELSEPLEGLADSDGASPSTARKFDMAIRNRPILRTPDGRGVILDAVYYAEKASVGPLFLLVRHIEDRRRGVTPLQTACWRASFCTSHWRSDASAGHNTATYRRGESRLVRVFAGRPAEQTSLRA